MGLDNLKLLNPNNFAPHHLHDSTRLWPETNCYIDLWIELLSSFGMVPEAAFGFTVAQDLHVDQFTFSKIPLIDLEILYGLNVKELSIYLSLEQHVIAHIERGSIVLMEVDAFYLPDTLATTYRQEHGKTTIAINSIDKKTCHCNYFHNATYNNLLQNDYIGIFRPILDSDIRSSILPPYVEVIDVIKRWQRPKDLREDAFRLLKKYFMFRPVNSPFKTWRDLFTQHVDALLLEPNLFHRYAFHFPRMVGSNFELLASHLEWLAVDQLGDVINHSRLIAQTAKIVQFRLARTVARGRVDLAPECFDLLEESYSLIMHKLKDYLA